MEGKMGYDTANLELPLRSLMACSSRLLLFLSSAVFAALFIF